MSVPSWVFRTYVAYGVVVTGCYAFGNAVVGAVATVVGMAWSAWRPARPS